MLMMMMMMGSRGVVEVGESEFGAHEQILSFIAITILDIVSAGDKGGGRTHNW